MCEDGLDGGGANASQVPDGPGGTSLSFRPPDITRFQTPNEISYVGALRRNKAFRSHTVS